MEITLSKTCLGAALARISGIADRKSSMQILSNVLISATGSRDVQIASTDLSISAQGSFPSKVISGGSMTLPAKTLHDIVRSLPAGDVSIVSDGDAASLTCGRSRFKLLGLPAEDFPRLPDTSGVDFFEMDSETLLSMIERTAFSISADETRPHINGALFHGDGKLLRMVTTDGHRLSKVEVKVEESGFYNFSMVIPNKGIMELRRLLDDGEGSAHVGFKDGSMFTRRDIEVEKGEGGAAPKTAEIVLVSKLIEAEFPPYDQVIPKENEKSLVISRSALLESMRRVSVVSSERTLGIKVSLSPGTMEIASDNPAVGEGSEQIDVAYDGEEVVMGFNAKYFIDVLGVLDDEEIKVEMSGSLDPAVVKDSKGFVGVIMPMRV